MNIPFAKRPRAVADPSALEAGVRDLMQSLRQQTDLDCAGVLANVVNTYIHAIGTFRGTVTFHADDIQALFSIWEIVLNTGRARMQAVSEFAPKTRATVEPANEDDAERREV